MSNTLAVSAVTGALFELLRGVVRAGPDGEAELTDTDITRKPPDQARDSEAKSQINLYLYQVAPNAAFTSRSSDSGPSPIALTLSYLITFYGKDADELLAHRLLGRAVRALHDQAVLSAQRIEDACKTYPELTGANLHLQRDRIRITPLPMSMDEQARIWGSLQSRFRLSLAYQVSAVVIESALPKVQAKAVETRNIAVGTTEP